MRLQLNITQPLMGQTGQLRWALNNVVNLKAPPCEPLLDLLKRCVLMPLELLMGGAVVGAGR